MRNISIVFVSIYVGVLGAALGAGKETALGLAGLMMLIVVLYYLIFIASEHSYGYQPKVSNKKPSNPPRSGSAGQPPRYS